LLLLQATMSALKYGNRTSDCENKVFMAGYNVTDLKMELQETRRRNLHG